MKRAQKQNPDLIVMGFPSDVIYQLISGPEEYHFVRIGWSRLSPRARERKIPTGGSDAKIRAAMKKGFSVPKREVESLKITMKHCVSADALNSGSLTLRAGGRTRRFILLNEFLADLTPRELQTFFSDVSGVLTLDRRRYDDERARLEEIREREREQGGALPKTVQNRLLAVQISAFVLPVLLFALWRTRVLPSTPCIIALMVLGLLPYALILRFPRYFSANEIFQLRDTDPELKPGTADLTVSAVLPGLMLSVGEFNDYTTLSSLAVLIAPAVILGAAGTALLTREHPGARKLWLVRLITFVILAAASVGYLLECNALFDRSEPQIRSIPITEKVERGHELTLSVDGEEHTFVISRPYFREVEVGDPVTVAIRQGALGIRYGEIAEPPDN